MSFLFAVAFRFVFRKIALRGGWWLISHLVMFLGGAVLHWLFS